MQYINKLYEGTTNAMYYVGNPLTYFYKSNNAEPKIIDKLKLIDVKKLSPYIYLMYDSILLNNNLVYTKNNINSLVYQLATLYGDSKICSYSYSIDKICEIIYETYIGNKFIAIYDYKDSVGYELIVYQGKGDNLHKNKFNNSITTNYGHVDILTIKNNWKKFGIMYESEYQTYNNIFVPCIDKPFVEFKNKMATHRIVIVYLAEKKIMTD